MNFNLIIIFLASILLSIVVIHTATFLVRRMSIVDEPDDSHKLHDTNTPFIGGVGVLAALCLAFIILINFHAEHYHKCAALVVCTAIIFITGFIDDTVKLDYRLRLMIQTIVALIMVFGGGVVLSELGDLFFGFPLQLGIFGAVFTVFATIGGINALNMIDGIDGLSGSVSLMSLALIGVAAYIAGNYHNLILIITLAGGVVGFLYFNLRHPSQHYARVFLGDNGSMLIGLMLAWLLVDLSQRADPAITPVTALWLFSVPLMDTIGVMLRRVCAGQSPFTPDRQHLHHLLMRSGFRVTEIVFTLTLLHGILGSIGLMGLYLGVPEFGMLLGFLLVSIAFFYLTFKPLSFISTLRNFHILLNTRIGFASVSNGKILIGNYSANETESLARTISDVFGPDMNFWVRVFRNPSERHHSETSYAITLNIWLSKEDCVSKDSLKQYITSLQRQLITQRGIHLHRFSSRKTDFDPAIYSKGSIFGESKITSRRRLGPQALSFEVIR